MLPMKVAAMTSCSLMGPCVPSRAARCAATSDVSVAAKRACVAALGRRSDTDEKRAPGTARPGAAGRLKGNKGAGAGESTS
jgi:hypothetical protein